MKVWGVFDEWEQDFHATHETQRQAEDEAAGLNDAQYFATVGTWYQRYSVNQVEECDECGEIVAQDCGCAAPRLAVAQ